MSLQIPTCHCHTLTKQKVISLQSKWGEIYLELVVVVSNVVVVVERIQRRF